MQRRLSRSDKKPRFGKALLGGLMISSLAAGCGSAPQRHGTTTPEMETRVLDPTPLKESEVVLIRQGDTLKAAVLEFEDNDEGPTRVALQGCKTEFDSCISSLGSIRSVKGAHLTFVFLEGTSWKAIGACEDVYANTTERMESGVGPTEVHFASCDISGVPSGKTVMVAFFPELSQNIETSDTRIAK